MYKKWFYLTSYGRHDLDVKFSHTKSEVFHTTDEDIVLEAKKFKSAHANIKIFELTSNGDKNERNDLI